jgi:phage shock protein E
VSSASPITRRRLLAALAALLVAISLAACGGSTPTAAPGQSAAPGQPAALPAEVDVTTAANLVKDGAFLLDVREPDEWVAGHVDGATLIPLGQLATRVDEVPRDRQVVVMCRSGNRSAQGRDILLQAGFPSVTSMAGGINEWTAEGKKVVTGN